MAYPMYNGYGYPAATTYNGYQPVYQQPVQYQQPQYQPTQPQGLPGKVVESYEIVKTTEVPIGSSAIFPQADMSAIYYKTWLSDGSTKIVTYKPEIKETPKPIDTDIIASLQDIYDSIDALNKKMDGMKSGSSPTPMKRREVSKSE